MKKLILTTILTSTLVFSGQLDAEEKPEHNYNIDTAGAHASIQFKVNHLGFRNYLRESSVIYCRDESKYVF